MKLNIQIGDHLWSPSKEDLETIVAMFSLPAKEDFVITLKPENVEAIKKPTVTRQEGPIFPTKISEGINRRGAVTAKSTGEPLQNDNGIAY